MMRSRRFNSDNAHKNDVPISIYLLFITKIMIERYFTELEIFARTPRTYETQMRLASLPFSKNFHSFSVETVAVSSC